VVLTGLPRIPRFAGTVVHLSQGAAERFNLSFVGKLLTFRQLDEFQHFLHLIHSAFQRLDDFHHLINRLADRRATVRGSRLDDTFGELLNALDQRLWLRRAGGSVGGSGGDFD